MGKGPERPCMLDKSRSCEAAKDAAICMHCGSNPDEYERRRALPLVKDEDGLRRKHIGVSNKPGRT